MTSGDSSFETVTSQWIHLVGVGIEIFGIFIIVVGIIWSSRYIYGRRIVSRYDSYKISIGKSLLLGLEVLVAADIVKTIAIELTFASLGLLAGLVLVRTFLSWTLVLEIQGRWPWQRDLASTVHAELTAMEFRLIPAASVIQRRDLARRLSRGGMHLPRSERLEDRTQTTCQAGSQRDSKICRIACTSTAARYPFW